MSELSSHGFFCNGKTATVALFRSILTSEYIEQHENEIEIVFVT